MYLTRSTIERIIPRRALARGAGALAAALLLTCPGGNASAGTRIVLLGTSGGPTWWPNSTRMGTSSALVVQDTNAADHIYLIDLGPGSAQRLGDAFNSGTFTNIDGNLVQTGYSSFLKKVKALFFTHLHMDHTTDFPALLLCGQSAGLLAYPDAQADRRLQVYGPGTRGQLEDVYPPGRTNVAPTMNPTNPTPGTADMTRSLFQAYAQTINNFTLESGWSDFSKLVSVHDIPLPPLPRADYPIDPSTGRPRNAAPWPPMGPILIYQDALVTVTATLVNHFSVYPNFAYRFDTADGSVVFSGDTSYPCTNLIQLAQGADVLVHEVIDPAFIDNLFPPPLSDQAAAMKYHLETSHTAITNVGKQATAAGVNLLVLNHIVPANTAEARLQMAQQNFAGRLIIGSDLMQIEVGALNPAPADFDGDGRADPALYSAEGNWHIWMSSGGYAYAGPYLFTANGGVTPAPADFDGDGRADPAVYTANGNWYIWFSAANYSAAGPFAFGAAGCLPAPGDFDGDGRSDPAVYTAAGTWYTWMSSGGYALQGPFTFSMP